MSVVYTRSDSVGRKIIPAPMVSINKTYQANEDGTKRGTVYSVTLTGTTIVGASTVAVNISSAPMIIVG